MKKKQFFYPLIWIILLQTVVVSNLYAQLSMERQAQEVVLPNTQTYDFIKHGTIGTSLYTGTVNYSIPVYTYKDKDFELPVSLDYASNGYKPNSRGGDVGVGWTLNVGGCITREVKGIPDEKMRMTTSLSSPTILLDEFKTIDYRGFLLLHKTNILESQYEEYDYVFDGFNNVAFYKPTINNIGYELTPDIYYFNFLGISGYFHLWYNNEIKVYCNDPHNNVSVAIEDSSLYSSQFIITTKDGYKYYFGRNGSEEYVNDSRFLRVNHTWKIRSIVAPNGRSITFTYSDPSWYKTYIENCQPSSLYYSGIFCLIGGEEINIQQTNITKMYCSPLTKIQISDGAEINFTYIPTSGEKHTTGETAMIRSTEKSPKLQQIKVNDSNGDILSQCNISYKITPTNGVDQIERNNNAVYFLEEAEISGVGKYEFAYYNVSTSNFPVLGTYGIDHWGYYNGKNENGAL